MRRVVLLIAIIIGVWTVSVAAEEAVTSFENDFEGYYITEKYITINGSKILGNGKPVDGDYTNTSIYPDGENSVYEGNAGNNMFVYDSKGNEVYGGLPGWCGYYSPDKSTNAKYNEWNRRLTVYIAPNDKSKNKMLRLEPSRSDPGKLGFAKENVDFSGISVWETDISITGGSDQKTPQTSSYEVSMLLTKNPVISAYEYENSIKLLTFSGNTAGDGEPVDVYFMGEKLDMEYVMQDYEGKSIPYLHIKYVLDNSTDVPKHFVEISDNGTVIAYTEPTAIENGAEFFGTDGVFGVQYYAKAISNVLQPRALVDNIKFYKKEVPQILNRESLEADVAELTNVALEVKLDTDIEEEELSKISLKDVNQNVVDINCELITDGIKVNAQRLEPQTVYYLTFDNLTYDKYFTFSDSLTIKTKNTLDITSADKTVTDNTAVAELTVKNNTDTEQKFIAVVAVSNAKRQVAGKIYYKKVTIEANGEAEVELSGIVLPEEEYTVTAYTVNGFSLFNALSNKVEL